MNDLISNLNAHYKASDDILTDIFNTVREIVKNAGGLIHTQNEENDTMYSVEYLSIDYSELIMREICGIRVVDDDLQIMTENHPSSRVRVIMTKEDLKNPEFEDEWMSLMSSENVMYVQTLINIAEFLPQYVS